MPSVAIGSFVVIAGCDLFPAEPPLSSVEDGGWDGSSTGGIGGMGGTAGAAGQGGSGNAAGSGGFGGSAGSGGLGGNAGTGTGGSAGTGGTGLTSVVVSIAEGADDANQDHSNFEAHRQLLWIGTATHKQASLLALRFASVPIPAGATIESASLWLFVYEAEWKPVAVNILAEAADDCAPFTSADPVSSREPTEASLPYAATSPWSAGEWATIDELAPLISEVVSRPGWASGQALCLAARGTGEVNERRDVVSYDGDPDYGPKLEIVYRTP